VQPGIRLKQVLGDFFTGLFNVDAPLPRTLGLFYRAPGRLTRSYVAGKRASYTPPVRYFLMAVGFYYLMRFVLDWDSVDAAVWEATNTVPEETPFMQVNHWISRNVNLLLPVLLVLLASFDRLLFPRTELNWAERLVHYIFASGSYLIIATLLIPFYIPWPVLQVLGFVVIFGTLLWAIVALHRRTLWNVLKAVVMLPVVYVLYVMLCMALAALLLGVPLEAVFGKPPSA
jgi:hypothetical protein